MNLVTIGALLSAVSVILGAFGAHALRGKIGFDLLEIYKTSTYYLTIHSIAILLYGIVRAFALKSGTQFSAWPAWCFGIGLLLFCGSLYTITFTSLRWVGAITPIGGVLFITGWIGFALQAHKYFKST